MQQTHELLLSVPLLLDYYLLTKSKGLQTQYLTWYTLVVLFKPCFAI
jgi:hypothetical protein